MEILGLLDALESMVLDGFKLPMTKKTIVNEDKILGLIDKIRLVAQGGTDFAKNAIEGSRNQETQTSAPETRETKPETEDAKATDILQQAYQMAKEIREGADKYADEVLSQLEASSTRILRTIKAGRERLVKK